MWVKNFSPKLICSLLLWSALFAVFSPPAFSLPAAPSQPENNFTNELLRLLEISTELTRLNETLRNELSGSRQNSAELQTMLETSKTELDLLKRDLEPLRTHSTELLITAVNSQRELNGLKTALKQAETSLRNSELSWSAYRSEAEQRIRRLERNKRWYAGLLIGSLTAAAAGWTAFALGR